VEDVGQNHEGENEEWGGVCRDEEEGEPAFLLSVLCLYMREE
jgi:hypothetical protein